MSQTQVQTAIAKVSNVLASPSMRAAFIKALPPSMQVDSYIQSVINAIASDPKLQECTPKSIALAAVTAASLGLSVGPLQEAYLVSYARNIGTRESPQWVKECQFQPGYRGWIKKGTENGQLLKIDARCVYSNEKFDVYFGSNERIEHTPNFEDPGKFVAVYAIAKLANGEEKFIVLPKKRVDELRARSKTSTAWDKDYDEMAKAKALRQLCKTIPMGTMSVMAVVDARAEQGESYRDVIDIQLPEEKEEPIQIQTVDAEIVEDDKPGPGAVICDEDYMPEFGEASNPHDAKVSGCNKEPIPGSTVEVSARQMRLITDFGKAITAKTSDTLWVNEQLKTKFGGLLPELSEDKLELAVAWAKGLKKA